MRAKENIARIAETIPGSEQKFRAVPRPTTDQKFRDKTERNPERAPRAEPPVAPG